MRIVQRERRGKFRFAISRDLRFKVLEGEQVVSTGAGCTLNVSSQGVAFETAERLAVGDLLELAISWPVLLDKTCRMQLVAFGHVVWTRRRTVACTIDRYEFRTQRRAASISLRDVNVSSLRRWADGPALQTKNAALA
ncbi:MAG TPA: PilZ domain-containing protein [Bryobacteraceae bacterium]|nr:PilZ domain-containing protein [Bryobacteraceae bacterium]